MWSSVVVLALPIALDPVRLGVNLLLISRPRPAQNLLLYWVGSALASIFLLLVPILVLHFTPAFSPFVHDLANPKTATSSTVRHLEIALGVLTISVGALLAVHFLVRQRSRVPAGGADTSTLVAQSDDAPNPISRLLGRGRESYDAAAEGGSVSATRRLLGRVYNAWEGGSLWIPVAVGFWAGPNPSLVIFALATIVTSAAPIGTQIGAAVVFFVETLAVVELVLLSHLVTPTRTEAFLRLLHDWARAYRRQILVAMFVLVGLALVTQGMGII